MLAAGSQRVVPHGHELMVEFWGLLELHENLLVVSIYDPCTNHCFEAGNIFGRLYPCISIPSEEAYMTLELVLNKALPPSQSKGEFLVRTLWNLFGIVLFDVKLIPSEQK